MSLSLFIDDLTSKIFKALVLKEQEMSGEKVFLTEYIDSVTIEALGATNTFIVLKESVDYISVTNTLQFLRCNGIDFKRYRREILKVLSILNNIKNGLVI